MLYLEGGIIGGYIFGEKKREYYVKCNKRYIWFIPDYLNARGTFRRFKQFIYSNDLNELWLEYKNNEIKKKCVKVV